MRLVSRICGLVCTASWVELICRPMWTDVGKIIGRCDFIGMCVVSRRFLVVLELVALGRLFFYPTIRRLEEPWLDEIFYSQSRCVV